MTSIIAHKPQTVQDIEEASCPCGHPLTVEWRKVEPDPIRPHLVCPAMGCRCDFGPLSDELWRQWMFHREAVDEANRHYVARLEAEYDEMVNAENDDFDRWYEEIVND